MIINKALTIVVLIIGLTNPSLADIIDNNNIQHPVYPNLRIINHPLIKSKLTMIRDKRSSSQDLRRLLSETAMLIGFEVTKDLQTKEIDIETPITKMKGQKLKNNIIFVPILRAGLGMVHGIHKLIPEADVAHIGMFKDQLTQRAVEYLSKLPEIKDQIFIVIDPEIASGNSAITAIDRLIKSGVPVDKILFMSLVVVPEGIEKLYLKYPTIPIYAASLDDKINEQASISPGLGYFGDRLFGTKQ